MLHHRTSYDLRFVSGAVPGLAKLRRGLSAALGVNEISSVQRFPNTYQGAFASERVRCILPNGRRIDVFAKYGSSGTHVGHGYWGGVEREAWVYEHVLNRTTAKVPRFVGTYREPESDETWLFLEWLDAAHGLFKSDKGVEAALKEAVRWLAQFHEDFQGIKEREVLSRLPRYDVQFFQGWWERTRAYSKPWIGDLPWLPDVLDRTRTRVEILAEGSHCVVHGEYYPRNLIHAADGIRAVDWQSAAISRGEVDLASLLIGIEPEPLVRSVIHEYTCVRWQGKAPSDFHESLHAARLYWPLRWAGENELWTRHPSILAWFDRLRHWADVDVPVESIGDETIGGAS